MTSIKNNVGPIAKQGKYWLTVVLATSVWIWCSKHKEQNKKETNRTTLKYKASAQQKKQHSEKATSGVGENICRPYIDKGLLFKIYKQFINSIARRKNKPQYFNEHVDTGPE